VLDRHDIIYGKFDEKLTRQDKNRAWLENLAAVNAVTSTERSLLQIQEKYKNMKEIVKSTASHNKMKFSRQAEVQLK